MTYFLCDKFFILLYFLGFTHTISFLFSSLLCGFLFLLFGLPLALVGCFLFLFDTNVDFLICYFVGSVAIVLLATGSHCVLLWPFVHTSDFS